MGRTRQIRGSNRGAMLCITAVLVVMLSFFWTESRQLRVKNENYVQRIASLESMIEDEHERAEEIAELAILVKTPEYAGKIAKEKLSLVGEDEILFRAED